MKVNSTCCNNKINFDWTLNTPTVKSSPISTVNKAQYLQTQLLNLATQGRSSVNNVSFKSKIQEPTKNQWDIVSAYGAAFGESYVRDKGVRSYLTSDMIIHLCETSNIDNKDFVNQVIDESIDSLNKSLAEIKVKDGLLSTKASKDKERRAKESLAFIMLGCNVICKIFDFKNDKETKPLCEYKEEGEKVFKFNTSSGMSYDENSEVDDNSNYYDDTPHYG